MFASLRLLRKKTQPTNNKPTLTLVVIGLMFIAVVLIRFWSWTSKQERLLLPNTQDVIQLEDLSILSGLVTLPTKTFDALPYSAVLYSNESDGFLKGTIRITYTKDEWRFVEIDYMPNINAQEYLSTHIYPTKEILLDQETSIWIQTIDTKPRCIDYKDDVPNVCEISRYLIADLPNKLLLIAADGDNATEGELVEIARSIISQTKTISL